MTTTNQHHGGGLDPEVLARVRAKLREHPWRNGGLAGGKDRDGVPNATKTHCRHGHEFTLANTRLYEGRRYCRACNRGWAAAWQRANRDRINAAARRRYVASGRPPASVPRFPREPGQSRQAAYYQRNKDRINAQRRGKEKNRAVAAGRSQSGQDALSAGPPVRRGEHVP